MKNILTIGKKGITSGDFFASVTPDYCNLVMFIDLENDDLIEKLSRYDLLIKAVMEESFRFFVLIVKFFVRLPV